MLWLDIETRSQTDLKTNGLQRYAEDITTELICIGYAFDDAPVTAWFVDDSPFPADLRAYLDGTDNPITAHNARFERLLFDFVVCNDFDLKPIALHRWRCSSARASAHGLPAALGDVCRCLNLPLQKQKEGTRLIRDYCAPGFLTEWKPGDKELMSEYVKMDVETMRQFCAVLRELTPAEWEQYHITEAMNDNGIPIDVPFVHAAIEYADDIRADAASRLVALTGGQVKKYTERKTRDAWLREHLPDGCLTLLLDGEKIKFDQPRRQALADHPDCPEIVSQFIELIDDCGGATISKYNAMANNHVDGRVYGALVWNGAGTTGRYTSRVVQFQNFRRDALAEPEPVIGLVKQGYEIDNPSDTLGKLIRAAIYSPTGLTFSDYSQIEARVLPWLANDPDAEKTLDVFRSGRDIYTETAKGMFNVVEVTGDLRQSGKVAVLSCGFGGGKGALKRMAANYGQSLSDDAAQDSVTRWRRANPWAPRFWYGLRDAAHSAFRQSNTPCSCGRIAFLYDGKEWLWMMLPSGRCIAYAQPKLELVEYPWGDEGWELTVLWGSGKAAKNARQWPRRQLSIMVLSENATQGTAADLMREAIVRAFKARFKLLFSVHDELVIEGFYRDELTELMIAPPVWAAGLPIAATTSTGYRYGK